MSEGIAVIAEKMREMGPDWCRRAADYLERHHGAEDERVVSLRRIADILESDG